MITTIKQFKNILINESITVKDPEFDEFVKANADKIVKRTSKVLTQLNKLLEGTSFVARGGYREGKRVGFWIENAKGDILLMAPQFKVLMDNLRNLAQPYATTKQINTNTNINTFIPPVKSIDPPRAVMTYDELRNMLAKKEYESGRFYINFDLNRTSDPNLFKLCIAVNSKRGHQRDAELLALKVSLPSLPTGYEYISSQPKDEYNRIFTIDSVTPKEENEYIDHEFGMDLYYDVKKTA